MKFQENGYPILEINTYGTHILKNPTGTYSFVGSVPFSLAKTYCKTYEQAAEAFKKWFLSLDSSIQREYAPNLRNDFFQFIFDQTKKGNHEDQS